VRHQAGRAAVFESVVQTRARRRCAQSPVRAGGLPDRLDLFGRLGKIEAPKRLGRLQIDQALTALATIDNRAHATGGFDTTPSDRKAGKLPKAGAVGHARKIRAGGGLHELLCVPGCGQTRLTQRQPARLSRLPLHQRGPGSVQAQQQLVGARRRQPMRLEQVIDRSSHERQGRCAGGRSDRAGGRAIDVERCPEGKFDRGFGKSGTVAAQPHQTFQPARRTLAGQQAQFVIEGGKAGLRRPGRRHRSGRV
jgi:hypothetical protein